MSCKFFPKNLEEITVCFDFSFKCLVAYLGTFMLLQLLNVAKKTYVFLMIV